MCFSFLLQSRDSYLHLIILMNLCTLGEHVLCIFHWLPGASTRDPTHDKVMRRRPDKQGGSGLQGFWKAAPVLTLKMISVFLMLAILDYSLISVTQVDGLPRSLSKQNQLSTLINMSPGWQYPIRLSGMKGVFQFKLLCWHFSLFGKCVYALGTNMHDCS